MMREHYRIPDWAQREREADLKWIGDNLDLFCEVSTVAYEEVGRGVIIVDTTRQPINSTGNPCGYFPQGQVEDFGDDDINRITSEYDPEREIVVVLLKSEDRTSTYRVSAVRPEPKPVEETPLQPPNVETLIEWEAEGGCEAACPHGCWVEPDGVCSHGNPSWLLKMGLI